MTLSSNTAVLFVITLILNVMTIVFSMRLHCQEKDTLDVIDWLKVSSFTDICFILTISIIFIVTVFVTDNGSSVVKIFIYFWGLAKLAVFVTGLVIILSSKCNDVVHLLAGANIIIGVSIILFVAATLYHDDDDVPPYTEGTEPLPQYQELP
jgi:hypothetical protein